MRSTCQNSFCVPHTAFVSLNARLCTFCGNLTPIFCCFILFTTPIASVHLCYWWMWMWVCFSKITMNVLLLFLYCIRWQKPPSNCGYLLISMIHSKYRSYEKKVFIWLYTYTSICYSDDVNVVRYGSTSSIQITFLRMWHFLYFN